ncbi:MAG: FkbM family methyltransferase [Cyclobacteriaceae bacterium]|nr:FkbM family methyltransferase [Cyclobacteriaceae bacterium]
MRTIINQLKKLITKKEFKTYGHKIVDFDLKDEGKVQFAQWLHPGEQPLIIDQSIVDFYKQLTKSGSFVIDIGTHAGDTTVPMGLAVGKSGLVLGLEPNPHVFHVLEANALLNQDKTNIVPLNFAATANDGEFTFASGDASFNNGGIMGFSSNIQKNNRYTFKVTGKNLEHFLRANYGEWLQKLALIKIDAEGYDKEILKTMPNIISEFKPVIITECFKHLTLQERSELFDSIFQHGYHLFYINGFMNEQTRKPISREGMNDQKHFDLVALPIK